MKIGIIVHSHTGNTLSVAERLKDKLIADGHTAMLERVTAMNEDPSAAANIQLKTIPDITPYDVLIFGAPVRAFSLSPVMKAYLSQLQTLKNKKIGCFVTQGFPFPWLGGNHAIKQMKQVCEEKGGKIINTGVVNWTRERETKIGDMIENMAKI